MNRPSLLSGIEQYVTWHVLKSRAILPFNPRKGFLKGARRCDLKAWGVWPFWGDCILPQGGVLPSSNEAAEPWVRSQISRERCVKGKFFEIPTPHLRTMLRVARKIRTPASLVSNIIKVHFPWNQLASLGRFELSKYKEEEHAPCPWRVNDSTKEDKLTVRRKRPAGQGKIWQRFINAEANVNKHDVIRCLKDGYIEEGRALGEEGRWRSRQRQRPPSNIQEAQTVLWKASDLNWYWRFCNLVTPRKGLPGIALLATGLLANLTYMKQKSKETPAARGADAAIPPLPASLARKCLLTWSEGSWMQSHFHQLGLLPCMLGNIAGQVLTRRLGNEGGRDMPLGENIPFSS